MPELFESLKRRLARRERSRLGREETDWLTACDSPPKYKPFAEDSPMPAPYDRDIPLRSYAPSNDMNNMREGTPVPPSAMDNRRARKGPVTLPATSRHPGLMLHPDHAPTSQEQLSAEVKSIYAGLVMVEAKCINVDISKAEAPLYGALDRFAQFFIEPLFLEETLDRELRAVDSENKKNLQSDNWRLMQLNKSLSSKDHPYHLFSTGNYELLHEQWQALIALHRKLLYEHHDFLMTTQHPSASPGLRRLAAKYGMPARMWKHGIHALLEVLRHHRPDSQDYMLTFIYLAYQMMALLFETVPGFTDTWIECLGDLARYRMTIEEEREAHAIWSGVASRWYTTAFDRHPAIGRLYHHVGLLERPRLRKFCLYAKSLTCVTPFSKACGSLSTLCDPIVQDGHTFDRSGHSLDARILLLRTLIYCQTQFETPGRHSSDPGSVANDKGALDDGALLTNSRREGALEGLVKSPEADAELDARGNAWRLAWDAIATFSNTLIQRELIAAWPLEYAVHPAQKEDVDSLSEECVIRGLIWSQVYFFSGWFEGGDKDQRNSTESLNTDWIRARRVLWIGLNLDLHSGLSLLLTRSRAFCLPSWSMEFGAIALTSQLVCVGAAPLPTDHPPRDTSPSQIMEYWNGNISKIALEAVAVTAAIWTLGNVAIIYVRAPRREPKWSGQLAIGLGFILAVLILAAPDIVDLRGAIASLYVAAQSNYIARMCRRVNDGRLYFWLTIGLGILASTVMGDFKDTASTTPASRIVSGLPWAPTLVACAAILVSKAIGIAP